MIRIVAPGELTEVARIDSIATTIEHMLADEPPSICAGVLATALARFLSRFPPDLRQAVGNQHIEIVQALLEVMEREAADQQSN